ncbi:hypothetical protein M758_9G082400 [Ceratodon purpureus]|nr:hypothetical protein M758_9G082400 [Ceratodon purpureus]
MGAFFSEGLAFLLLRVEFVLEFVVARFQLECLCCFGRCFVSVSTLGFEFCETIIRVMNQIVLCSAVR